MQRSRILMLFTSLAFFVAAQIPHASATTTQPFQEWLEGARQEALQQGISRRTVDQALGNVTPIERVIELDRRQPEGRLTFADYRQRVINQNRINQGRRLMREHATLLNEVSARYGVQPEYIVSLWGLETSFGANTGGFDIVPALATLAWDGRRGEFFRRELMTALRILDEGHIDHANMRGSWAGAMGQNQFMPSSFISYAVDGSGDGRKDIWNNLADVFASTANYLAQHGWKGDERWGRAVSLPSGFNPDLIGLEVKKPLAEWRRMGVTQPNGQPIPVVDHMQGSIVAPDGVSGPTYIVYDNFRTIMRWNRSTYFATTVGLLADSIAAGGH